MSLTTAMLAEMFAWLVATVLVAVYLHSALKWRRRSGGRPLPPGPKGWPLVGNLFNVPRSKPWVGYRDLCSAHGDIVHLRILGQSVIALGSTEVISEYLEKRSLITSDRLQSPLFKLLGCDMNFGLFPYGQRWRRFRGLFWQYFSPGVISRYQDAQRAEAHKFLARLLEPMPAQFQEHIRYNFSSVVLKIVYGIDAADKDDPYIAHVDAALEAISQGLVPGKFLVEIVPALDYLPSWFPGAGWKKLFAKWRTAQQTLKHAPFTYTKNTNRSHVGYSVVGDRLESLERAGVTGSELEEEEAVVMNVGAVAFEAGADTTLSTLQAVFLAMSLYPDVLQRAQAELDAVVGPQRLPDFSDQPELVYVSAVIKEALRWHNVAPLCIPHCLSQDDEFHGYFVPKGTVILPNIWACMRDPVAYEEPDDFRPERFIRNGKLDPSVRDPFKFVFGFGRRICPGRHFAEASLFINIASVLHAFSIAPPVDEHGQPIKIVPRMTDGLLSYPEDIRCLIKPRSTWAAPLIVGHA